ncbi:hypothetical protein FGIG_10893 [Fasciola gigantica]|uniref:Neutral sphingomyelinase n=1 Tax=Fasciola gigantica TaxID=46835 RepID=A0A504YPF6_FASGI|nr:hypothetical protein FGIG_10893 [Fasciola gigantica]
MIDLRRLSTILLGLAISLVIVGLATSYWSCGSLFDSCQRGMKDVTVTVIVLLLIGLVSLCIVFILDLVGLCTESLTSSPGYITARFVLIYLGSTCLLIGILVFTGKIGRAWSYFVSTVGCVFAIQVAILAIMSSRCTAKRERVVVTRTVRA